MRSRLWPDLNSKRKELRGRHASAFACLVLAVWPLINIVGDGPMMAGLRAQAESPGVAGAITFHGWLDHGRAQDVLGTCHLFAFP